MAESIAYDLVEKAVEFCVSAAVQRIAPYFGGRGELEKLEDTMRLIQARLIDAEKRQEEEGGAAIKEWLRRLKHVLYRLEDLFEEVDMADRQRKQMGNCMQTNPVRLLSFEFGHLKLNKRVSQNVVSIIEDLERIKSDMVGFNLIAHSIEQHHTFYQNDKRETYSYVKEGDVVGRKNDKEVIVKMLLDSHDEGESVSIIPIIGMGGLGKTTLAQLCFNDKNVEHHFELKGWACISVVCSLKELVVRILNSVSNDLDYHMRSLEYLQNRLREIIDDKRYLLVLDDVWDEDRATWLELKSLLSGGKQGSKIIVTTRSPVVADIMGTIQPYQLQGLTEEESWTLFERLAFRIDEIRNPKLTSIGRGIVKKCMNVPLAIRTIASLLYSKRSEREWEHFNDRELKTIEQSNFLSTLKLSYDHLPSHLKQCFAYCSVFPKDYELEKENLIWLWMAQGFIRPSQIQTLEDVGDEYFTELLRRCFFQDVIKDKYGRIVGCKMHDLFHDLACKVGEECQLVYKSVEKPRNNGIRHVSFVKKLPLPFQAEPWLLSTKQMRSVLVVHKSDYFPLHSAGILDGYCSSFRCLRALDLGNFPFSSVPKSLWKLKHLRYLRIYCWFDDKYGCGRQRYHIPNCIAGLQNLQVLCFTRSSSIELPPDFNKLTRLRHLIFGDAPKIDMPPKFGQLTSLQTLNAFVVGENNGLDALGRMENLVGELTIRFRKCRQNASSEAVGANLKEKRLTSLSLRWPVILKYQKFDAHQKALEGLDLPPTLRELKVENWCGMEFPRWGSQCNELSNLVSIKIIQCVRCKYLPPLSQLPLLKYLHIKGNYGLEYIESRDGDNIETPSAVYFPSLEELILDGLSELKGWSRSRGQGVDVQHCYYLLPRLSKLWIRGCSKLEWIPLVPMVPSFKGESINGKLLNLLLNGDEQAIGLAGPSMEFGLKEIEVQYIKGFHSLSINLFSLESLDIWSWKELVRIKAQSPMSLRRLQIGGCPKLKDISSALQHLTVLEELIIYRCEELDWPNITGEDELGEEEERTSIVKTSSPWERLKNLRYLKLKSIKKWQSLFRGLDCVTTLKVLEFGNFDDLTAIPESIGNLTQLCELKIWWCPKLSSLPNFFTNLTNLRSLKIQGTTDLCRRCEKPNGEDWPLIQHIPYVQVRDW